MPNLLTAPVTTLLPFLARKLAPQPTIGREMGWSFSAAGLIRLDVLLSNRGQFLFDPSTKLSGGEANVSILEGRPPAHGSRCY
jgi:hypothetical protein